MHVAIASGVELGQVLVTFTITCGVDFHDTVPYGRKCLILRLAIVWEAKVLSLVDWAAWEEDNVEVKDRTHPPREDQQVDLSVDVR